MKLNEWESKTWGRTKLVEINNQYQRHELGIEKGGYCSFHYHLYRSNLFHLQSGLVRLVWCYAWEIQHVTLKPHNTYRINARIPHQFQVLESGMMVEEYYPQSSGDDVSTYDINRLTIGGSGFDFEDKPVGVIQTNGELWTGGIES